MMNLFRLLREAPPKKKVVKKVVKKPVEAEVRMTKMSSKENEVENGASKLHPMQKTIEGLVMRKLSTLNQLKKAAAKKKSPAAKKEKEPSKECQHMYVKGKNAGTKCTTTVKGEGNYCSKHKSKAA